MLFKNKIFIYLLFNAGLLISCNRHSEEDGHGHGVSTEQQTTHIVSAEKIATLTAEQIRTVGIEMGTIEMRNLTNVIKANGVLRVPNNHKGLVTSMFGGVVKSLQVEMGDHVKKGQIIAIIENAQFVQLQEEYIALNSKVLLAEQEMNRQIELNEGNAGVKRNLQTATAELNMLKTRKASLFQQIKLMGIDPVALNNSNMRNSISVTSPISGTVSEVYAQIGSYIDVSAPVAEVVDNNSLHLDLQIFEKDLPLIKIGQSVDFTITNNPVRTYKAEVFNIGSSFQNESKTIAVHSNILGDKLGLIDGMNITALISVSDVTTISIQDEAIVEADGKYYIYVQSNQVEDRTHNHTLQEEKMDNSSVTFEKIEVVKGVSDMGYTSITPVKPIAAETPVAVKGAFFIHAKLNESEAGHDH
jgi:RND family efflux transporter MFP subunit